MVAASLLPDCGIRVVPIGVETEVPVLPELAERVGAWAAGELEERCSFVGHWGGGVTQSSELWEGSVPTVVLGK